MKNQTDAKAALMSAWPYIVKECRQVLGSELHYQAMIYHCLRQYGKVPLEQMGMNVKMWIDDPVTDLFRQKEREKHPAFRGGFEPIPDVVIFKPSIKANWRRRNYPNTRKRMLLAIEVKASELENSRIGPKMITDDIDKLASHRLEIREWSGTMIPVVMVIDTAEEENERMLQENIPYIEEYAKERGVGFFYVSQDKKIQSDW